MRRHRRRRRKPKASNMDRVRGHDVANTRDWKSASHIPSLIISSSPFSFCSDLQSSSFSSITDSTMSLNIITVTLNMGKSATCVHAQCTRSYWVDHSEVMQCCKQLSLPLLCMIITLSSPCALRLSPAEKYNFLGISIVGQSNERGDGGIYIGSIMKGGAVAADGRIEPGDMLLQVCENC